MFIHCEIGCLWSLWNYCEYHCNQTYHDYRLQMFVCVHMSPHACTRADSHGHMHECTNKCMLTHIHTQLFCVFISSFLPCRWSWIHFIFQLLVVWKTHLNTNVILIVVMKIYDWWKGVCWSLQCWESYKDYYDTYLKQLDRHLLIGL